MPIASPGAGKAHNIESLDNVPPKPSSHLSVPVSLHNSALSGACSWENSHGSTSQHSQSLESLPAYPQQRTIDLSTTTLRPMYGPGFLDSDRQLQDQRYNNLTAAYSSSNPTVLNYRDYFSRSGFSDILNSSSTSSAGITSTATSGATTPTRSSRSPGYDFRETAARRRSYQETLAAGGGGYSMQSAALNSGSHRASDDTGRKSESPSRKRRRMSHGGVELATSPSPPLVRPWMTTPNHVNLQHHRPPMAASAVQTTPNQRYSNSSGEWCNNSGRRSNGRRSPPSVRRQSQRQRERQMRSHTNQTPPNSGGSGGVNNNNNVGGVGTDRRAFHPPTNPAAHHPRPNNNQTGGAHHSQHPSGLPGSAQHHQQRVPLQPHIIIDLSNDVRTAANMEQETPRVWDYSRVGQSYTVHVPSSVPLSIPVSVPTYAVPICTAHSIPACSIHHGPYPTLSVNSAGGGHGAAMGHTHGPFPICSMGHIPMCSVHIPSCGTHHLPISAHGHASAPPILPQDALVSHIHHSHHHVPHPQVQYISAPPPPHQTRSSEMDMLEQRQAAFHVPSSATHHNPSLTPSPPVHILQEPILRAAPTDLHHMHSQRLSLNAMARQRRGHPRTWRNQVSSSAPLQPTYPSWFLHYLFPNPPVNPGYQVELENEDAEVENYEALLNLAERLGEAKPRGLSKAYIDQLPSYRYNPETHQSINDQTCCVVCMSDFEQRQLLRVLPCSHEFHARCVDKWLKTNRTCPICRSDASEMKAQTE